MKQTEAENRIVFYPVPRFRRRNATAKIEPVNGSRVEIFPRPLRKNTTRPLIGLIGGTGGEVLIVLGGWLWYNKSRFVGSFMGDKVNVEIYII